MKNWLKIVLLLSYVVAYAGPSDQAFNLFLPTQFHNPAQGRSDALRLEWQNLPLGRTGEVIESASHVMDKDSTDFNVTAYFSPERSVQDRIDLFMEIQRQVNSAFPGQQIPIKTRVVEETERLDPAMEAEVPNEIRNSLSPLQQPKRMRDLVENISMFKAFMGAGQRAVQLYLSGVNPGPEAFAAGLALGSSEAVLDYYGTKYEVAIGNALATHSLPLPKGKLSDQVNNFYANNPTARFIKGTLASIGIWGIAAPTLFQTLSHISNPSVSQAVSGSDIGRWLGLSTVGNIFYFGGFSGLENLRQKGWLSQTSMDAYLRGTGLLYTLSSVLNTTGRPEVVAYLPFVIAPMWALYGAPAVIAPLLKPKTNRLVFADPNIKSRDDLNQLEALESTRLMPGKLSEQKEELSKIREFKPIIRRWHNRAAEKVIDTGSAGVKALTRLCSGIMPKSSP